MCIVHTSDFGYLEIYKNDSEWHKGFKFLGKIEEEWFYNSWKFHIYLTFLIDFMSQ